MKSIKLFAILTFVLSIIPAVAHSENIKIYKSQGGATMTVASGGTLNIASGGALQKAGVAVDLDALTQASQATDGLLVKRIARATYDVAVDLGTIAPHLLGVTLPANAIINNGVIQIKTQFADAGTGTVALSCGSATILTAADITGSAAEAVVATTITSGATAVDVGTSACELTATVAGAAQTQGKLVLFVEYYVSE
jgi:hypothetical protein